MSGDMSSTVEASNRAIAILTFVAIIGIGSLFFTVFYIVASWWQAAGRAQGDSTAKYEHDGEETHQQTSARQAQETTPHLPTVLPAQIFDASDTTPVPALMTLQPAHGEPIYCPSCYVIYLNTTGTHLFEPAGRPEFCLQHAYSTLARALMREGEAR